MREDTDYEGDPWFDIAERIKTDRKRAGLTRQQLAGRVGVSRGTIFNWESGKRIPIEKCAQLAAGLDVPADDLLALHPEVPTLDRPARKVPDDSDSLQFTRREVTLWAVVGVALLVGMGFITWTTASASCTEVGAGNGLIAPAFREAHADAGGRLVVGCAVGDVRKWGPGLSQSLDGGEFGEGAILSLDRDSQAYVLTGELWQSYRWIASGASTDVAGYPVSDPLECNGTYLVLLAGGAMGPGALIETANGEEYLHVSGSAWVAYREAGGPFGPLGRPDEVMVSDSGITVRFESGSISAPFGALPTVSTDGSATERFDPATCDSVSVAVAAGI